MAVSPVSAFGPLRPARPPRTQSGQEQRRAVPTAPAPATTQCGPARTPRRGRPAPCRAPGRSSVPPTSRSSPGRAAPRGRRRGTSGRARGCTRCPSRRRAARPAPAAKPGRNAKSRNGSSTAAGQRQHQPCTRRGPEQRARGQFGPRPRRPAWRHISSPTPAGPAPISAAYGRGQRLGHDDEDRRQPPQGEQRPHPPVGEERPGAATCGPAPGAEAPRDHAATATRAQAQQQRGAEEPADGEQQRGARGHQRQGAARPRRTRRSARSARTMRMQRAPEDEGIPRRGSRRAPAARTPPNSG